MTAPTTWHADDGLLAAYVGGALDGVEALSVEQHLVHCAACRGAIRAHVDPRPLALTWDAVRDEIDRPPLPLVLRLAQRLGLSEPTALLLAASAALRTSWLVSGLLALGFATLAALVAGPGGIAPFLLVAPLVPVLGVAATYGGRSDPLEGLIATSPYGRTRLVLVRTLAVLVTVLPFAFLLGLTLPGPEWIATAWLGPALALVPITLAVSSVVGPRTGASAVAIAWSGVVLFSLRQLPATWPVEPSQQLVYLAIALAATAYLAVRARLDRRIGALL